MTKDAAIPWHEITYDIMPNRSLIRSAVGMSHMRHMPISIYDFSSRYAFKGGCYQNLFFKMFFTI